MVMTVETVFGEITCIKPIEDMLNSKSEGELREIYSSVGGQQFNISRICVTTFLLNMYRESLPGYDRAVVLLKRCLIAEAFNYVSMYFKTFGIADDITKLTKPEAFWFWRITPNLEEVSKIYMYYGIPFEDSLKSVYKALEILVSKSLDFKDWQ
jgi:hypothetical protein